MEDSPKKRGRKAIPADQLRRPHTISFTDAEYARLCLNAKACGMNISAYVIARTLDNINPFRPNPKCRVSVANWQEFAGAYPGLATTTHSLEVLRQYVCQHGPQDGWFPHKSEESEVMLIFNFVAIDLHGTFIFEYNGGIS